MARIVLNETYRWNDNLCECAYQFGEDGYLVMDGSAGRIQCVWLIASSLRGADSHIRLPHLSDEG